MKKLNELQNELDNIRVKIDTESKYAKLFEIVPSDVMDNDRDLEVLEHEYRLVKSERGKTTGTTIFKNSDELIFYFLKSGISQMVAKSPLGIGTITEERLRKIMDAEIELMKRAKPEWVNQYKLDLEFDFSENLKLRKRMRNMIEK